MNKNLLLAIAIAAASFAGIAWPTHAEVLRGYTDTPMLPAGKWHVHDPNRPQPVKVTPGANSGLGTAAPADATILFDGTDFSHWEGDKGAPQWLLRDRYIEIKPGTGYLHTKEKFTDFQLHVEFSLPADAASKPDPGNSGVFLQGVYEVQVYDMENSYIYADGGCGAIYGQSPPLVNACRKRGEWQSFDITFEAARWNAQHELVRPALVTVFHNGVLIQNRQTILGPSGHRILANFQQELPPTGPLSLQEHGDVVRYRNIWIRKIQEQDKP